MKSECRNARTRTHTAGGSAASVRRAARVHLHKFSREERNGELTQEEQLQQVESEQVHDGARHEEGKQMQSRRAVVLLLLLLEVEVEVGAIKASLFRQAPKAAAERAQLFLKR